MRRHVGRDCIDKPVKRELSSWPRCRREIKKKKKKKRRKRRCVEGNARCIVSRLLSARGSRFRARTRATHDEQSSGEVACSARRDKPKRGEARRGEATRRIVSLESGYVVPFLRVCDRQATQEWEENYLEPQVSVPRDENTRRRRE